MSVENSPGYPVPGGEPNKSGKEQAGGLESAREKISSSELSAEAQTALLGMLDPTKNSNEITISWVSNLTKSGLLHLIMFEETDGNGRHRVAMIEPNSGRGAFVELHPPEDAGTKPRIVGGSGDQVAATREGQWTTNGPYEFSKEEIDQVIAAYRESESSAKDAI
jgi:hypothetical protein